MDHDDSSLQVQPAQVYRKYDQAGLDAQYDLRALVPEFQEHFDHWERESERVRTALSCRLDVPYGDAAGERLDLFPAPQPEAPVHIFIHGGYWRSMDKASFSFVAEPFVQAGCSVAVINYDLAPHVAIDEIVRQARSAVAWCTHNAATFAGDPERIFVSGHSAGGHLTAMVLSTDWAKFAGLPDRTVKGSCAISGLYDLEPLRLCYLNEDLRLDEISARRNSPIHHLPPAGTPLIVSVGASETDEFIRQSANYAAAQPEKGFPCQHMELTGLNHFTIVESLGRSDAPLTQAILRQMGLGKAQPA